MRRFVLAIGILSVAAHAGDWHPNPGQRYHLMLSGSPYQLTDGDKRWAGSLVAGLRKKGGEVRSWEIAPRCAAAALHLNDTPAEYLVFRKGEQSRYLVLSQPPKAEADFYVDFESKSVLVIGGIHTTSVHVHPRRNFAVVVYTYDPVIYGIPLSAYSPVTFEGESATWVGGES